MEDNVEEENFSVECFWSHYFLASSSRIPVDLTDLVSVPLFLSNHNRLCSFIRSVPLLCKSVEVDNSLQTFRRVYHVKGHQGRCDIQFCLSDFKCQPFQHYNFIFFENLPYELTIPIVCVEHKVNLFQPLLEIGNDNKSAYFALDVQMKGFFPPNQSIKVAIDVLYESFQVVTNQNILLLSHVQDLNNLSDSCREALLAQMISRFISKKYLGESLKYNRYLWLKSNQRKMIAFRVNNVSSTHMHQSFRLRAIPVACRLDPVDAVDSSNTFDSIIDFSRIAPGYTETAFQVIPRLPEVLGSKKRKRKDKGD